MGKNAEDGKEKDDDEDVSLSFAQMEGKCYCCRKAGHKSPLCRDKNKPKEQWAINKARQSHAQAAGSDRSTVASVDVPNQATQATSPRPSSGGSQTGWAGTHIDLQFHQFTDEMRDWILLDNQSSVTIFCNKDMVNNVRESENGQSMYLATNGGTLVTTKKATLSDWGDVWFNEQVITNTFGCAEMSDRYRTRMMVKMLVAESAKKINFFRPRMARRHTTVRE